MKKVVAIFRSYPFFFKPIQDGTTNPRMELAFREPSKRITKNNKTSQRGDALNTVINWKNTTNNAYDGEKLHMLYLDEAGKWEKPTDIREAWRIERTCLIVGKRIVGKALVGSTVNPMNKGGKSTKPFGKTLIQTKETTTVEPGRDSTEYLYQHTKRLKVSLISMAIQSWKTLRCLCLRIDGEHRHRRGVIAKTYLKTNEREPFKDDPSELNEIIRQFPFTEDEAFRDSIEGSLFNIGKIYQQIEHNDDLVSKPCC